MDAYVIFIKLHGELPTYSYVNVGPPSPGQIDRIANLRATIYDGVAIPPLWAE